MKKTTVIVKGRGRGNGPCGIGNRPRGPENGYPSKKAESVGSGKKTSTKSNGFK